MAGLAKRTSLKEDREAPHGGVSRSHHWDLQRPEGPPGEGISDAGKERGGEVATGIGSPVGGWWREERRRGAEGVGCGREAECSSSVATSRRRIHALDNDCYLGIWFD